MRDYDLTFTDFYLLDLYSVMAGSKKRTLDQECGKDSLT